VPTGNPVTTAKVQLGKALFFEEQISADRRMACATCHVMERGSSDPRASDPLSVHPGADGRFATRDDVRGSLGLVAREADGRYRKDAVFGLRPQVTDRRAMPVINAAFARELFWDGRSRGDLVDPVTRRVALTGPVALEVQALVPLASTIEMAHFGQRWSDVVDRLKAARPLALATQLPAALASFVGQHGYPELFRQAFGTNEITAVRIAMALATYQRTLISDRSRADDFLRGNRQALTAQEARGEQIFRSPQAACVACHGGPLGTDNRFHYTGVADPNADHGLEAVTRNPQDRGRMRTPSVRNVALRAPYFHDGSAPDLAAVVEFYDRGGNFNAPNKDLRIRPLRLSAADKVALVAFLQAWTDPRVAAAQAPFDRPRLWSEGPLQAQGFGAGTAGPGNFLPQLIAAEPALLGSTSMTLGLDRAVGGGVGLLAFDPTPSVNGFRFLGMQIHLGLSSALLLLPPSILPGNAAGEGWSSWPLPLPSDPKLSGLTLHAQSFVLDVNTLRFSATAGSSLPLFF
jgi:cytochrome c peroxidase